MKFCPKCQTEYGQDALYCARDGAFLIEVKPFPDPLVGQVINGKYRIIRELGQGGMGKVYLAEHVKIGMSVAIKVVHAHFAQNPEFVKRFQLEASLVARLKHHNIVGLHDFDQMENGSLFIVMECMEGKSLRNVIARESPLEIVRVLRLGAQIAEGLAAAHRGGVIHRDIKPDNIMVVEGDEIRVMDFGLAREAARETPSSVIVGSPAYMSPEQARGEVITASTDIYAMGVVLYEMLGGEVPFKGSTPEGVLRKHITETPPPIKQLGRQLPTEVEKLVMQALEKKPESRPKSAQELAKRLKELEREPSVVGTPKAREKADAETVEIQKQTGWIKWAGVGLGTTVLVAGLVVWTFGLRKTEGPPVVTVPQEKTKAEPPLPQPAKSAPVVEKAIKRETGNEPLPSTITVKPPLTKVSRQPPVKPPESKNGRIKTHIASARSYSERGEYSQALAELENARSIDPENKELLAEVEKTRRACSAEKKLGRTGLAC